MAGDYVVSGRDGFERCVSGQSGEARQDSRIVVLGLDVEEGGVLNERIGWIWPVLWWWRGLKGTYAPSSYTLNAAATVQALPRDTCESSGKPVAPVLRDKKSFKIVVVCEMQNIACRLSRALRAVSGCWMLMQTSCQLRVPSTVLRLLGSY